MYQSKTSDAKSPDFTFLYNSGSKFSAKSSPIKQISQRSGPSHARATVFCGSEMDANINSLLQKILLPGHGRPEKQNFLLPSHLKLAAAPQMLREFWMQWCKAEVMPQESVDLLRITLIVMKPRSLFSTSLSQRSLDKLYFYSLKWIRS